jgi:type IX secretion system PorP/SprF family membrane protein
MNAIRFLTVIFCVVFYVKAISQQDPVYSMSALQPILMNPASMGTRSKSEACLQYRNQWMGPSHSKTIFAHYNGVYQNGQMASGMTFLNDRMGAWNRSMLSGIQSYHLSVYGCTLSVAMNVNLEQYTFGLSQLSHTISNEIDEALLVNGKQTFMNFGASAYAYSDQFWIGFSMPHLVRKNLRKTDDPKFQPAYQTVNTMVSAGGIMSLVGDWDYKPYVTLQWAQNVTPQLELGAMAYWKKRIGGGVSYRFNDALIVATDVRVSDFFRLGYSYDRTISSLGTFVNGAHEIMLRYYFGGYQGLR